MFGVTESYFTLHGLPEVLGANRGQAVLGSSLSGESGAQSQFACTRLGGRRRPGFSDR